MNTELFGHFTDASLPPWAARSSAASAGPATRHRQLAL